MASWSMMQVLLQGMGRVVRHRLSSLCCLYIQLGSCRLPPGAALGGTTAAATTVLLGRGRPCCYCLVSHLLLKRCLMTPGFAKVEMSPSSWSFWAIFLRILLVIFPERVLGRLGAYWM